MISFIAPVAAGNAAQLLLSPPAGALRWRVLRKRFDTITAADDAGSNVIYEGNDKFFIDRQALLNGTEYFYRAFYLVAGAWVSSASRFIVVAASFADISSDVIEIVRERIDLGFQAYMARGLLSNSINHIPVLLATPAYEDATWPLVTVHLVSCAPSDRFVGEVMVQDHEYSDTDEVGEVEGWLSRYQLQIIAWSINGDVRAVMRNALMAIVKANLPIFESTQMSLVEDQYADADDMQTYSAPMYQATCMLSFVAPTAVEIKIPTILYSTSTLII